MTPDQIYQITNAIMPIVFVLAIGASSIIYQYIRQRMPDKQRSTLDHLTNIAVMKIEQIMGEAAPDDKKHEAVRLVIEMFQALHLPIPPASLIDAAIEAAVFALPQPTPPDPDPLAAPPKPAV